MTGTSRNVHVSRVASREAVAREVARYVARPASGEHPLTRDQLVELIQAVAGRRMCIPYGRWGKAGLTKRPAADTEKIWIPVAPLADLIQRRAAGEKYATEILSLLWNQSHPSTGPPHLFFVPTPRSDMAPDYFQPKIEP